jgi:hypothetical protein
VAAVDAGSAGLADPPTKPDTRDAWRDSVSRVDALDLRPPLAWDVYGDHYTLDD